MRPSRRVRVTSPQTRIALARRHRPGQHLLPLPAPADVAGARAAFRRQRRIALATMAGLALVVFGMSGLVAALPELDHVGVAGVPLSWLLAGAVAYPLLLTLAVLHVLRAERAEQGHGGPPANERRGSG
ncbi:hypothetical protein F4561_003399 [Lipingzhangella halophila]|uniref:Uncharacterized protein n=1 Tax=Lipingzhangella halophila TaxID=1783352 RepID=A0A7W7W482_9ACTN|nr:hypothetical protein [Lipingzhangella halophila]MBB4932579.1 hypothetical protein [Lipingzhangella halophila]